MIQKKDINFLLMQLKLFVLIIQPLLINFLEMKKKMRKWILKKKKLKMKKKRKKKIKKKKKKY